jgi:hypothetical protein
METDNLSTNQRPWLYQPGQSGNPAGKPKGKVGGRAAALLELDSMMATTENRLVLRKALQEHFLADPVRFFKQIIMPLLPTEVKMKLVEEGAISWVRLSTMYPIQDSGTSTTPVIDVSGSSVVADAGEKPSASPPNS